MSALLQKQQQKQQQTLKTVEKCVFILQNKLRRFFYSYIIPFFFLFVIVYSPLRWVLPALETGLTVCFQLSPCKPFRIHLCCQIDFYCHRSHQIQTRRRHSWRHRRSSWACRPCRLHHPVPCPTSSAAHCTSLARGIVSPVGTNSSKFQRSTHLAWRAHWRGTTAIQLL